MKNQPKTNTEKVQKVQEMLNEHNTNPWENYQSYRMIEDLDIENKTLDEIKEMLRRDSISAYHKEEAACGCI